MEKMDCLNQFGKYTFNKKKIKEFVPQNVYNAYCQLIEENKPMPKEEMDIFTENMKKWALDMGATHYTHWFSSLNGMSAEKHQAFLELEGIEPLYKFNSSDLLKGESDASSFPSGGLRTTYKAGGYTTWDYRSYSFVKDNTLYIPSLFYSSNGEALDYKTHLLMSCNSLNQSVTKLLSIIGKRVNRVDSFVGVEQEYFLIKENDYNKRIDIQFTGRTLYGKPHPKTQDQVEHYYSSIKENIRDFMSKLDAELWKYGIPSKTKHNEKLISRLIIIYYCNK